MLSLWYFSGSSSISIARLCFSISVINFKSSLLFSFCKKMVNLKKAHLLREVKLFDSNLLTLWSLTLSSLPLQSIRILRQACDLTVWRWLRHTLSKGQSQTAVLLRIPITQMIFFNQDMLLLEFKAFSYQLYKVIAILRRQYHILLYGKPSPRQIPVLWLVLSRSGFCSTDCFHGNGPIWVFLFWSKAGKFKICNQDSEKKV